MKDILLITPPFTQLNTPYPATAYLKGFLNTKNISAFQMDLGIEVILKIYSKDGLRSIFEYASQQNTISTPNAQRIYALREQYIQTINDVISFLQGSKQTLARQINSEKFLPQASRFEQLNDLEWAFGSMGMQDKAKHLSTIYLEDISDFIVECVDENFGFSRYAERLGQSANSFEELHAHLQEENTYVDNITLSILVERIEQTQPKLVCISIPFPGNLYSGFRCAQYIKKHYPHIKTSMGGGFPNTELRSVSDTRVFDYFDFITLDDGELPVELLVTHVKNQELKTPLKRTFLIENNTVFYNNTSVLKDYKQLEVGTPDYSDLLLNKYISVIEVANPMHSLWSDGRWNKLTMAHGCYWGKCTFCDISLDYIKLYEPLAAKTLVDRVEQLIEQTGETGFHFVDEAAPPALMRELALEILRRKLIITWWTNIRFEKNFTQDLCILLKASGCIAVSGGLEVASDRLLALIDKGVTVEQVAQVTRNFTDAGMMVHSYLMYGYPSQTIQETIDSLEMVRQLFEQGIIQSGFWHQFALTAHSPIGINPEAYNITTQHNAISFANNDVQFKDKTGIEHDKFSYGLKKSLYNYMHGMCFDFALQEWFDFKIPKTTVRKDFIAQTLLLNLHTVSKPTSKIIWLGSEPEIIQTTKSKKGQTWEMLALTFHNKHNSVQISVDKDKGEWLINALATLSVNEAKSTTYATLQTDFEQQFDDFILFWNSKPLLTLRANGLLTL